jgi:hypothetical protein
MAGRSAVFLLETKFSLRSGTYQDRAGIADEEARHRWLVERCGIFSRITLASLKAQERRPHRWYLLLADGDQSVFHSTVADTEDWIVPLFIKTEENWKERLDQRMLEDCKSSSRLIVTRADNDDALHRSYFARLEKAVDSSNPLKEFINFRSGCRWDGKACQLFDYPKNPFLSRTSPGFAEGKVRHPLAAHHIDSLNAGNHLCLDVEEPMWLQYIHGRNISNRFETKHGELVPMGTDRVTELFGFDASAFASHVGTASR